jgi:hypothetical protein
VNNLAHLVEPEILDIRIQKAGYNNAKICKNKENKRASMTVAKRVLHCVRATLKNHAKYEKMCDAIEPEKRVAAFLYLVPNYELRYGITDALCQMKQLVLFALVDKFTKDCSACVFATHCYRESSAVFTKGMKQPTSQDSSGSCSIYRL